MRGIWNAIKPWHHSVSPITAESNSSLRGILESGDFRIDLDARTAALRGERLQLTTDEFDVLVFVIRHPQSLVTPRSALMTKWASPCDHRAEFLRALVSLRKKLEAAGSGQHYLRTEPWIVYRFDPTSSSAA